MKAHAGDHIIVAAPTTGGSIRDGEVLEVHGADGSPPYLIRWTQSGETGLFFPGSDAHVAASTNPTAQPTEPTATGKPTAAGGSAPGAHVRSWRVNLDLYETEDETNAHAVLVSEAPRHLDASGAAYRNPADQPVPEIGDEIAVARALRRLSDRLFELASADIAGIEGTPVTSIARRAVPVSPGCGQPELTDGGAPSSRPGSRRPGSGRPSSCPPWRAPSRSGRG